MICEKLEWDSSFFGFDVSRLTVEDDDAVLDLVDTVRALESEITYVFIPSGLRARFSDELINLGAECFDNKITYIKESDLFNAQHVQCVDVLERVSPELLQLARDSGWCSRFNRDQRFKSYSKELYQRWLERDLNSLSSVVLGIVEDGRICGMVTVTVTGPEGQIGLVAVCDGCRGSGYGSRLIAACEKHCLDAGCTSLSVVTQELNAAACRCYERCGFKIAGIVDVWHLWKIRPGERH